MRRGKPVISLEDIRRGHATQRKQHGENYSEVMRQRGALGRAKQLEKYGGEEGLSKEMSRRRKLRDDLKDTGQYKGVK